MGEKSAAIALTLMAGRQSGRQSGWQMK